MTRTELEQRIAQNRSHQIVADGVRLVESAKAYALLMHGEQKYGTEPYSVHLEDVETILIEFNHISSVLRAAAWLHDLEDIFSLDTPENRLLFELEFKSKFSNTYLYIIVEALTSEPGKNRKERNKATYVKIAKFEDAIIVKLADRLANGRKSKATGDSKFSMYKKEYAEFREALYTGTIETIPMWWELDRLFEYKGV